MTAQAMSDQIVAAVTADHKGVGVIELVRLCGAEAKGERALEFQHNLILANGVSDLFVEAMRLALPRVNMAVLPPILVHTEPMYLGLPIAKQVRPYKTPRWLPVILLAKGSRSLAGTQQGKTK
jgi:hypothetical protein